MLIIEREDVPVRWNVFKCMKRWVKSRTSRSSCAMGMQMNSTAFNESAFTSLILLWDEERGKEGSALLPRWLCVWLWYPVKSPQGYLLVSCFDRCSRRALDTDRVSQQLGLCAQYWIEWHQLMDGKAVYERGRKGISQKLNCNIFEGFLFKKLQISSSRVALINNLKWNLKMPNCLFLS